MKLMKKYNLILAFCIGLLMTSCHFLDIDMENTIAASAVDYSNTANMYQPVIGAYAQLRISGCHWANNMLWTGRDDDMTSGRKDDQGDALRFGYRGGYNYQNSYWALRNAWVTMYEIIRTCNSALDALDKYAQYITDVNSADYADYQSYVGEVKTIRAWAYYYLVTTFGPCVILKDNSQTNFVRSTVSSVYTYAMDDLQASYPKMKHLHPSQMVHVGAFSAYTAEALLARFALMTGDFQLVKNLTDDIINSGKFALAVAGDDYYNMFKIPGKLCSESIMEVQVSDFGNPSGKYIGVDQWFVCQGAQLINKNGADVSGWTFMRYNPEFLQWAKNRGESSRLEVSFLVGGTTLRDGTQVIQKDPSGMLEIYNGKAYITEDQKTEGNTEFGRNNNVRLLRYAEVLLMNAEANARLGGDAQTPLDAVRSRASMPSVPATIENILDERRMELCGEWGLRYTDLVRTQQAASVLNNESLLPRDVAAGQWTTDKIYWPVPGELIIDIPDLLLDPK